MGTPVSPSVSQAAGPGAKGPEAGAILEIVLII